MTKFDKQRIVELLDRRGETGTAAQVEALLPPEVDLDVAQHRSVLERLGVGVEGVRALGRDPS